MADSRLLANLARAARERQDSEDARFERYDRLTDGTLSAEEEAELRALGAGDPEAAATFEAFRPLGSAFRDRVVGAIAAPAAQPATAQPTTARPAEAGERSEGPPSASAAAESAGGQPPRTVLRFRGRWLAVAGAALAAAAELIFLIRSPAALPAYTLTVAAGVATERGESRDRSPIEIPPGGAWRAEARPAAPTDLRPEVRCFVRPFLTPFGAPRDFPVACSVAERGERGALRLAGTLPADLAPGPAWLWIVLGTRLPDADALPPLATDRDERRPRWVAVPIRLDVRAP